MHICSLCIYHNVNKISIFKAAKVSKTWTIYMFRDLTRQLIWAIEIMLLTPDDFIVLGYPEIKKADQVFVVRFGQILVSFQDFNITMYKKLTQRSLN